MPRCASMARMAPLSEQMEEASSLQAQSLHEPCASFRTRFCPDERAKTYKIVMAHDPMCHQLREDIHDADRKLVTEIYHSATGRWAEGSEYSIQHPSLQFGSSQRGVLCNGVIYFVTASTRHNHVLLSYNTAADQWHEDHHSMSSPVFEWDGCLMSIASREWELHEFSQDNRMYFVVQWDPVARSWKDSRIEVPSKVRGKFLRGMQGTNIVASGNHMVVAAYSWEYSLRITVYRRAENYWRPPPSAAFSDKIGDLGCIGVGVSSSLQNVLHGTLSIADKISPFSKMPTLHL